MKKSVKYRAMFTASLEMNINQFYALFEVDFTTLNDEDQLAEESIHRHSFQDGR